jgi:hypothetical protein
MLIRYVVVLVSVVPIVSDSSLLDAIPMPELSTAETRTGMGMGMGIKIIRAAPFPLEACF